MRRLVITDVLPRDREPVFGIVHEGWDPIARGNGRRIDAEPGTVGKRVDRLFAPVAKEIRVEEGRRFCAAVRDASVRFEYDVGAVRFRIVLVNRDSVLQFPSEIAVPVAEEVDGHSRTRAFFAGRGYESAGRPRFRARRSRIDVVGRAAAHVAPLEREEPEELARSRVAHIKRGLAAFVHGEDFQAGPIRN